MTRNWKSIVDDGTDLESLREPRHYRLPIGLATLAVVGLGILYFNSSGGESGIGTNDYVIKVADKWTESTDGASKRRVTANIAEVLAGSNDIRRGSSRTTFRVADDVPHGHFTSEIVYGSLTQDNCYKIKTVGKLDNSTKLFPNIIEATAVSCDGYNP